MTGHTAVLYARVSSREQREEGYSIEAQVRLLRETALNKGFEILREFIEIESAKTAGRKVFDEMVTFLKRNRSCRILLVEKTDRLYRNQRDALTISDLDIEVHFVKEGEVLSKDAKSQVKFISDIRLAMARNYSENLREEVKKGMLEKCSQGDYPGHAPFGYRNNKATRKVEVHPDKSVIAKRIFELYASGRYSLSTLLKELRNETGVSVSKSNLHKILINRFYIGEFQWGGQPFKGNHECFITPKLFAEAQSVLLGVSKAKYGTQDIPFRGMLTCRHCGCMMTGERVKASTCITDARKRGGHAHCHAFENRN